MNSADIENIASRYQTKAKRILQETRIIETLQASGLRVSLIGSLRMGLLVNHRDIDLHVYSKDITVEFGFEVISKIAANPGIIETLCINGMDSDEHCLEWHLKYRDDEGEIWQIDIIHIEEGSRYDGYFERMADRIVEIITPAQRDTIMRLKYLATLRDADIHGAEIYEGVIEHGISEIGELSAWVEKRRTCLPCFWSPR